MTKSNHRVFRVRPAGEHHAVFTIRKDANADHYQKRLCQHCPWRKDAVGQFPPEAFRHSAETAHDMSNHVFACHAAGAGRPTACAGFLLSESADHNLSVRLSRIKRRALENIEAGDIERFTTYREMAIANGVDENDPALAACR